MVAEIAALKFKFDPHALPATCSNSPFCFAIGESVLHRFDQVTELFRQHSEQQHGSLLVHRFVPLPAERAVSRNWNQRRWRLKRLRLCRIGWIGMRLAGSLPRCICDFGANQEIKTIVDYEAQILADNRQLAELRWCPTPN